MATDSRVTLWQRDYSHTSPWMLPLCSQAHPGGTWICWRLRHVSMHLQPQSVWENRRGGDVAVWSVRDKLRHERKTIRGRAAEVLSAAWKGGRKHDRRWIKKRISVISSEGRWFMKVVQMWSDQHSEFVIHNKEWRMPEPLSQLIFQPCLLVITLLNCFPNDMVWMAGLDSVRLS